MSTAFPLLLRSDHRILRSESCSGYVDIFGIWNTGFYCPQSESKSAVYCCGTDTYKYCCTAKNSTAEEASDLPISTVYIRTPVIIGVITGTVIIAAFIVLVVCLFCPCCFFYRKRTSHIPTGLYRIQCGTSSTTSALVNLHSPFSSGITPTENNNLWTPEIFTTTMRPPTNLCRDGLPPSARDSSSSLPSSNNLSSHFPNFLLNNDRFNSTRSFNNFWNSTISNGSSSNDTTAHQPNYREILETHSGGGNNYSLNLINSEADREGRRDCGFANSTQFRGLLGGGSMSTFRAPNNVSSLAQYNSFIDGHLRGPSPGTTTFVPNCYHISPRLGAGTTSSSSNPFLQSGHRHAGGAHPSTFRFPEGHRILGNGNLALSLSLPRPPSTRMKRTPSPPALVTPVPPTRATTTDEENSQVNTGSLSRVAAILQTNGTTFLQCGSEGALVEDAVVAGNEIQET